jgi:1,4-alpha-glucan branching enzyme
MQQEETMKIKSASQTRPTLEKISPSAHSGMGAMPYSGGVAFRVWAPNADWVVVVNLANRAHENYTIGFPRAGTWRVRFNSDFRGYDESFGNHLGYDTTASPGAKDGMPCSGNLGIGPYSVLILSQDG